MSSFTYHARGLVLKRTKLGETDVICTLLSQDGSQLKAIAKGARKPTSPFTSRLELFSTCDLLLAKGKSLDIIKEARLIEGNANLRTNLELTETASPMVELLTKATLDSLENDKLFPLTFKALHLLNEIAPDSDHALPLCIAHLIKAVSFLGFKPQLHQCIGCGSENEFDLEKRISPLVSFSYLEGGVVCGNCKPNYETQAIDYDVIRWAEVLLYSTLENVETFSIDRTTQLSLLRFIQTWIKIHVGYSLKSLNYIFSYGLPS